MVRMGMILGIIHYVGGFFVVLFWGGLFFSLVSVVMMVMMMMNGKHICPHEMVFFLFQVIYIFCAANRFFLPSLSHPRSYTCKDSYLMLALLLLL